ncbi:MAG: aldehyde dehydrogenase family protein [Bacteroidales bacterium]|nr:aldehyde dehydrogenase family protein [Bacteroidales bacterium]
MMNTAAIDNSVKILKENKDQWARLPIAKKIEFINQILGNLKKYAREWVDVAITNKQIDAKSPWVGEEWIASIWALAAGLQGYKKTLTELSNGKLPKFKKVEKTSDGRIVIQIYPNNFIESLLLNGITAEVWMQKEVTFENLDDYIAIFYKQEDPEGKVALVLGAGNVNSIAAYDTLYRMIAHGQVVLLKMNPVNQYLTPVYNKIFEPFILSGYLQIISGGADVGQYLTHHPDIDEIHITGSSRTHDAIVYGTGEEGEKNRKNNNPILQKPITSELGGVVPLIVLPGKWNESDIRYQAEKVVTSKLHNNGFNCISTQVLILPEQWSQKDKFLDAIRDVLKSLPPRKFYYPGSEERLKAALEAHPQAEIFGNGGISSILITNIPSDANDECCFKEEAFCPVLAQTGLPGDTTTGYLKNAVDFCNEKLFGTLGATILAHPKVIKELGTDLKRAITDLRYGSIGINVWDAVAFLLPQATWGAFPGHTLNHIQSGIGVVHSTFLLEKSEKTVAYGSFYSFPRGMIHGDFIMLPKPPWFVTNKSAHKTAKRTALYAIDKNALRLPGIFASAMRG